MVHCIIYRQIILSLLHLQKRNAIHTSSPAPCVIFDTVLAASIFSVPCLLWYACLQPPSDDPCSLWSLLSNNHRVGYHLPNCNLRQIVAQGTPPVFQLNFVNSANIQSFSVFKLPQQLYRLRGKPGPRVLFEGNVARCDDKARDFEMKAEIMFKC